MTSVPNLTYLIHLFVCLMAVSTFSWSASFSSTASDGSTAIKEMLDRVMSCDSYQKALNIISEYVETELSPKPTPKRGRGDAR